MNSSRTKKNVILLGSYGRGNIGDDIFLIAVHDILKNFNVVFNSSTDAPLPRAIKSGGNIIYTNSHNDFLDKVKFFLKCDYFIYGGGDLWVNLYGDKFPKKSLWKMVILNLTARTFGKKVIYLGCGAGRLRGFSLILAKISASMANYIIARESETVKILNLKKNYCILPDLAVTLFNEIPRNSKSKKQYINIGIASLYYVPEPEKNFEPMIEGIVSSICKLDENKVHIQLIPMLVSNSKFDDLWTCKYLASLIPVKYNVEIVTERDPIKILSIIKEVDLMIGIRLHASILAVLFGIPAVGISYRDKVKRFFNQLNLSEYCLEMNDYYKLDDIIYKYTSNTDVVNNHFKTAQLKMHSQREKYDEIIAKILR